MSKRASRITGRRTSSETESDGKQMHMLNNVQNGSDERMKVKYK